MSTPKIPRVDTYHAKGHLTFLPRTQSQEQNMLLQPSNLGKERGVISSGISRTEQIRYATLWRQLKRDSTEPQSNNWGKRLPQKEIEEEAAHTHNLNQAT